MLRHCMATVAAAIVIGWYISASAFAGHVGFGNLGGNRGGSGFGSGHGGSSAGGGGRFFDRYGEFRRPAERIGGRFSRGFGIGVYPNPNIETPYLDFEDYESSCGFFWVDRIFNQRVIRQRVYACP